MKKLSTGEAGRRLQVSPDTILLMIKSKELPAERLRPNGHYKILENDLQEYAKQHNVTLLPAEEPK